MAYLIGLAALISTAPVLEVEITVAVWAAQGQEVNQTLKIDAVDRILGSIERIAAMLLILAGLGWIAPLLFLPRLLLMIYQGHARENRTAVTTKIVTSFATAVIVSLLLLNIPVPLLML